MWRIRSVSIMGRVKIELVERNWILYSYMNLDFFSSKILNYKFILSFTYKPPQILQVKKLLHISNFKTWVNYCISA